jgi:hypothetical protein
MASGDVTSGASSTSHCKVRWNVVPTRAANPMRGSYPSDAWKTPRNGHERSTSMVPGPKGACGRWRGGHVAASSMVQAKGS